MPRSSSLQKNGERAVVCTASHLSIWLIVVATRVVKWLACPCVSCFALQQSNACRAARVDSGVDQGRRAFAGEVAYVVCLTHCVATHMHTASQSPLRFGNDLLAGLMYRFETLFCGGYGMHLASGL